MTKSLNLNSFLNTIQIKKNYLRNLKEKIFSLKFKQKKIPKTHTNLDSFLVMYIISIYFSRTNTLIDVKDFSGKLKFFASSGLFKYFGKSKKARSLVFKKFYRLLINKLKFLKNKPIALHLSNVGNNKYWISKQLKKRFFVKVIKSFDYYPHNGCRKKKPRRKKFRTKRKNRNEEMAERFKAADCKSVEKYSS